MFIMFIAYASIVNDISLGVAFFLRNCSIGLDIINRVDICSIYNGNYLLEGLLVSSDDVHGVRVTLTGGVLRRVMWLV